MVRLLNPYAAKLRQGGIIEAAAKGGNL